MGMKLPQASDAVDLQASSPRGKVEAIRSAISNESTVSESLRGVGTSWEDGEALRYPEASFASAVAPRARSLKSLKSLKSRKSRKHPKKPLCARHALRLP